MAHSHSRRICSKLTHCLTRGIDGTESTITRQINVLPQIGQTKTRMAGYHGSSIDRVKPNLRLMPLGASVTYGSGSADGNGYRKILQELLTSDGYNVEMVGSRKAGSMENNDNEGWRGFRIDQVATKAKRSVPQLLPNLFTLNVGSNDCIQDFEIQTAGKRMSEMLEYLWTTSARSTVVLSTLIPNLDQNVEPRILCINEQFGELAKSKAAEGRRIVLVDMHGPDGPLISDLVDDGTHPNDAGYAKMAAIWCRGIDEAILKGFIQEPQ